MTYQRRELSRRSAIAKSTVGISLVQGLLVALVLAASPGPAEAQDAAQGWRHTMFIYGMGAAIDGDVQVGDIEIPVDVSISDMFDALEMGAMAAYRMENDTWSISGDVTFMALGGKASGPRGHVRGDVDIDQLTVMATLGRRVAPSTEVLFSLAYFDLSTDVHLRAFNQSRRAGIDADWVDPSIGLRYETALSDKWTFTARGDVGGFGVGSDLLVHGIMTFRRQQTERFGWFLGYRVIRFDYENGKGRNFQHYDLVEQGPGAGISISF
jgi:hypothetical protein